MSGEVISSLSQTERPKETRRVEVLPLSQILPDRFQPRPLLPSWIRNRYFAGDISCYDAAREWLEAATRDAGIHERVVTLKNMGKSFASHGQIKPITGTWREITGQYVFVIETGERRFWGACLAAVEEGFDEEPTLQVLPVSSPARERQVIENQHAEPPSAVGRAREIAALLLEAAGIVPPVQLEDDYDYFRAALDMRHKMVTWTHLEEVMGVSRPYMVRLLKVLNFPTHLLEMADNYQVSERVLREVLDLPADQQESALVQAIQEGFTHQDVQQLATLSIEEEKPVRAQRRNPELAHKMARKLKGVFRELENDRSYRETAGTLASYLVTEINDRESLMRAVKILEDLAVQIRIRVE